MLKDYIVVKLDKLSIVQWGSERSLVCYFEDTGSTLFITDNQYLMNLNESGCVL